MAEVTKSNQGAFNELRSILEKHGSIFSKKDGKIVFSETKIPLNEEESATVFRLLEVLNIKAVEQ